MTMGLREYFVSQADLADELYQNGRHINCHMGATAALDALAAIWLHNFPADATALESEFGGKPPASVRMARFLRRFAKDSRTDLVAVIRFCEDAQAHATGSARAEVDSLLAARKPNLPGELPPAHMDMTLSQLAAEAPTLLSNARVRGLAEEYQYAALLYTLYRCPTVHALGYPKQSQGYARNEEVFYMQLHSGFTSIGFGHKLITNWLRNAANGFVDHCDDSAIKPADGFNPGVEQEARLQGKWAKAF